MLDENIAKRAGTKVAKTATDNEKLMYKDDESIFNSIFKNHSSIMLLVEPLSGKIIDANNAASKFYGYTIDELIKMNINSINQLKPAEVLAEMQKAENEVNNFFTFPHKCANGEIRMVEVHSSPIEINKQKLLYSIIYDVTKRSDTETELYESKNMLANVIDGINVGTWHWNIATGEVIFNERWAEILGYTLKELEPLSIETWVKYTHPEDLTKSNEAIQKHFAGDIDRYEAEVRMLHKNGKWVWVSDRGRVYSWDEDGKPLRMAGTHQDITERKLREVFEAKLLNLSVKLTSMTSAETSNALQFAMSEIGEYLNSDRAYIFEIDETQSTMDNTYEWCNNGINPEIDGLKNIPLEIFPMWMKSLRKHETIIIPSVKNLTKEWQAEKDILEPQGVQSLIVIPLISDSKVIGFVGLDSVSRKRIYTSSEINILHVWSHILGGLLNKKIYEEMLNQTRNNYETFFNTINDFLFILDVQGNIIHTNSITLNRLGYTKEELFEQSVLMVHPEDRREEANRIVGEMLNGSSTSCLVPLIAKSGQLIPVETRVVFGKWNNQTVIFGISKDISEILLSEEKFSKTFYLSPAAGAISDFESGKYIEINDAFSNLFGFTKQEVIGKSATELGIMSKGQKVDIFKLADNNGRIVNVNAELKAKNGEIKNVFMSSENIFVQDKKLRFALVNDVTEHKIVEKAFRISEEKFRTIISSMTDSIFLFDNELKLVSYFGKPENKFILNNIDLFIRTDDEIRNKTLLNFREKAKQVLEGKSATYDFESEESENEKTFWHFSLSTMYDDLNNVTGIVAVGRDLTLQNEYKKSVESSELKLSEAQKIANLANWEYNVDNQKFIWSEHANIILECDITNPQNNYELFVSLIFNADRTLFLDKFEELIETSNPFDITLRLITKTKLSKIVKVKGVKGKGDKKIIGTMLDVTDLIMAKHALDKVEYKYQKFFDESPLPIIIFGENGEILEGNFAFCTLVEIEKKNGWGKEVEKIFENPLGNILEGLKQEGEIKTEINIKLLNGKTVNLMVNGVKLKSNEFLLFLQDLSSIKDLTSQINTLYKQYTSFFEAMQDSVSFVEIESGKVIYSNHAAEVISGFPLSEINTVDKYISKVVHPDDKEFVIATRQQLAEEGFSSSEYRIMAKDKEIKWVWEKNWVVFDEDNQPIRIDGLVTDITKIKQSEQDIKNALQQEISLNELKSQFISTASHEFRTPLTTILSSAELLEHYGLRWDESKVNHHMKKIKQSVGKIQGQLKDVLLLEKSSSKKLLFDPERGNLKEFCEQVVKSLDESKNMPSRVKFEYLLADEYMVFDEKLLEQILMNIIGNALKYSSNDSLVHVTVKVVNEMVLFVISDKGIGIPDEDQHQVFDAFFRSKNIMKIEGTGLGMSIVKNAIDIYKGEIEFTSNQNIGTTFLVRIPILKIINDEEGYEEENINN